MTDPEIRAIFAGASDFEYRALRTGQATLYAYFIDGLVSGSFVADYIYKPITLDLPCDMVDAYNKALRGGIITQSPSPVRICRMWQ